MDSLSDVMADFIRDLQFSCIGSLFCSAPEDAAIVQHSHIETDQGVGVDWLMHGVTICSIIRDEPNYIHFSQSPYVVIVICFSSPHLRCCR